MPINQAKAQAVTLAFTRDYPGALELAYKFRDDVAEMYGLRAADVPADMKGGYVPKETMHAGREARLGHATVVAFDSGNLPHVARALHEKFPDKPIVLTDDDDKHQEAERGHNPGRVKAEEAAKAVGGTAIFPIFAPGEQQANPKGLTDFNDLTKLGRNGLRRQVTAAVGQVLEEGRRQPQEQQEQQERRLQSAIGRKRTDR